MQASSLLADNFAVLNKEFDKILVLTITRAVDRRAHIEQALQGLDFEFFYGVEKQNLHMDQLLKNEDISYRYEQTFSRQPKEFHEGTVACAWSHRNMYEYILKNGWKKVLILEDDIDVSDFWKTNSLKPIFTTEVEDVDLWALGHMLLKHTSNSAHIKRYYYSLMHALRISRWNRRSMHYIAHQYAQPLNEFWVTPGQFFGTHAYAINQKAAEVLIQYQTPIGFTADWLLNYALLQTSKIKGVILKEPFFIQDRVKLPSILN